MLRSLIEAQLVIEVTENQVEIIAIAQKILMELSPQFT
jgi:hypothetical protein